MKGRWQLFRGKRAAALILTLLMLVTSIPMGAFMALAAQGKYGTVSAVNGTTVEIRARYSDNKFSDPVETSSHNTVHVECKTLIRTEDGWKAEVQIAASEGMTSEDFKQVEYESKIGGAKWPSAANEDDPNWKSPTLGDGNTNFTNIDVEAKVVTLWIPIKDVDTLRNASKVLEYRWRFNWDHDKTYDQIVELIVDPEAVVLMDKDGRQMYPNAYVSFEPTVTESGANKYAQRVMTITVPKSVASEDAFAGVTVSGLKAEDLLGKPGAYCQVLDADGIPINFEGNTELKSALINLKDTHLISIEALNTILKNTAYWQGKTEEYDEYSIKIKFVQSKIYKDFTVSVNGREDLASVQVKGFALDITPPAKNSVSISYSDPVRKSEDGTIQYYKGGEDGATVTLKASDTITGVQKFIVTVVPEVDTDVDLLPADVDENKDGVQFVISAETVKNKDAFNDLKDVSFAQDGAAEDTFTASFTVPFDFRGHFACQAVDDAGNLSAEKKDNLTIVVDKTAPAVNVTFDSAESVSSKDNNTPIYNQERTMTITVQDPNFSPETGIRINGLVGKNIYDAVSGKVEYDIIDNTGKILKEDVQQYGVADALKDKNCWTVDEKTGTWVARVKFTDSAIYPSFTVSATDLLGNSAETVNVSGFIYDADKPTVTVTYTESVASVLLNALTFGVYKDEVKITLTARDGVSGVEKFIVTAVKDDSAPAATSDGLLPEDMDNNSLNGVQFEISAETVKNKGAFNGLKDVSFVHDEKQVEFFVATFTVPAAYRGNFSYEAMDYAGNKSENGNGNRVVIDNVSPKLSIAYKGDAEETLLKDTVNKDNQSIKAVSAETDRYIFNGDVTATLIFKDANLDLCEPKTNAVIEVSKDGGEFVKLGADKVTWEAVSKNENGMQQQTAEVKLTGDGDYRIRIQYNDVAKNAQNIDKENSAFTVPDAENNAVYTTNIITVDTTAPKVEVQFDPESSTLKKADTEVYGAARIMTVTVTDRNFRASDFEITILKASNIFGVNEQFGKCEILQETTDAETGEPGYKVLANVSAAKLAKSLKNYADTYWFSTTQQNTKKLTVRFGGDLEYSGFNIAVKDIADNKSEKEVNGFIVDQTAPNGLKIAYSSESGVAASITKALSFGIYTAPVKVTLTAKDTASGVEKFIVTVKPDADLKAATSIKLPADIDESKEGVQFEISANTPKTLESLTDISFKQNDETKDTFTASFIVPAKYRGGFSFTAADCAENKRSYECYAHIGKKDNPIMVIDTVSPTLSFAYAGVSEDVELKETVTEKNNTVIEAKSETDRYIFNGDVKATLIFKDANLDLCEPKTNAVIEVSKDGGEFVKLGADKVTWEAVSINENGMQQQTAEVKFTGDGDYRIRVQYNDAAKNAQEIDKENSAFTVPDAENNAVYTTNIITVDATAPKVEVQFDPESSTLKKADTEVYGAARTMTITVTDRNFRVIDGRYTELELTGLTAANIFGKEEYHTCDILYLDKDGNEAAKNVNAAKLADYLRLFDYWTTKKDKDGLNTISTIKVRFTGDAVYPNFKVTAKDLADNNAEKEVNGFIVDQTKPTDVNLSYDDGNFIQTVTKALTFGVYNPSVQVNLIAKDDISGVKKFIVTAKPDDVHKAATNIKLPADIDESKEGVQFEISANTAITLEDLTDVSFKQGDETKDTFAASFTVPAAYRGAFSVEAVDYAGNVTEKRNESVGVVTDTTAPTLSIQYLETPQAQVDAEGKAFKNGTVDAYTKFIYNRDVTAILTFTDANLDLNDPKISVSKDNKEFTEVKPQWSAYTDTDDGQQRTATVRLEEDGDYRIRVQYSDAADNAQKLADNSAFAVKDSEDGNVYTTNILTVDKTSPILTCVFPSESNAENVFGSRAYFQFGQTVDLKIREHNFKMMVENGGLNVDVLATNSQGASLTQLKEALKDEINNVKNWHADGNESDTYHIQLSFKEDANYTFKIAPKDLANNEAANSPQISEFTVDSIAPHVEIHYAQKVMNTIIDAITFGYYNAQVEATVTAVEDTAGVYRFEYEGLLAEGVSEKNQSVLKNAIEGAQIRQEQNQFIAKFNIPRETLNALNSFNGTVTVSAYDRAERVSTLADTERLVVDNIAPTCNVTFSPEVQTVNDISYYNGPLTATVQINEANFYAEDVFIRVNGMRVEPTDWAQNGDVWTSTITLTNEGDYKFTVEYTDRSGNTMFPSYVSNQKTIDTTLPTIHVRHTSEQKGLYESANNEETIGFILTVTDRNLGAENITPKLVSVQRDGAAGGFTFSEKEIDIGAPEEPQSDANGNLVYTYKVDNLPQDGYYTLTCDVKDYANHIVNTIEVSSANGMRAVETVPFSVNREGSAFWLEAKHNGATNGNTWDALVNDAYVNQEVEVVLHEVNVDRVNTMDNKQTVLTLNDGSKAEDVVLNEGENYEKNTARGAGGWFESIYTLRNDNFKNDGYYSLNILTYDAAGNTNINQSEQNEAQGTIRFTVDRTAPVITFNANSKQGIKADSFPLEMKLTEMNLEANSVAVTVRDNKGKETKLTPEELKQIGNDIYQTELKEGMYDSVTVYAKDLAGNESTVSLESLTVSPNDLVLFYAGHPVLCWFIILLVPILTGFILFFVLFKKKRKKEN